MKIVKGDSDVMGWNGGGEKVWLGWSSYDVFIVSSLFYDDETVSYLFKL